MADAGHGAEEVLEAFGIAIQDRERVFVAGIFIFRQAGAQGAGEIGPVRIEAEVGHLKDAADVGGLALVEEEIGLGGVGVDACLPFEEAEGDESVEEVVRGAGMQVEASAEGCEIRRALRELGEELHFDCAEEDLRGPEGEAGFEDAVGAGRGHA